MALFSSLLLVAALVCTAAAGFFAGAVSMRLVELVRLKYISYGGKRLRDGIWRYVAASGQGLAQRLSKIPRVGAALDAARRQRRQEDLCRCIPDALQSMCVTLDAGGSVSKALHHAAQSCGEPLATELKQVEWDLQAGRSFSEAMELLRQRTGGTELAYLAVAMEVQHRSGGSLGRILRSVTAMVRSRANLASELTTKTAQAQLSARIVALMPVLLLAVLSLLSPGYLSAFFESPLGAVLLVLAVLLEVIGIFLVRVPCRQGLPI